MTTFSRSITRGWLLWLALCAPLAARAGGNHDHDHGQAGPSAPATAWPRFAAVSEQFELVGVLQGLQLTLYLDRLADNSPVPGATIELTVGEQTLQAKAQADAGTYGATLTQPPPAGELPVTATVTLGTQVDLLAGELDLHELGHDAHDEAAPAARRWAVPAAWAAAGLLAAAVLMALARRRQARRSAAAATATGAAA